MFGQTFTCIFRQRHMRSDRCIEFLKLTFVEFTFEHPEWFTKFQDNPDVVRRWVETHLLDLVNRGKASEALAAPRPLANNDAGLLRAPTDEPDP